MGKRNNSQSRFDQLLESGMKKGDSPSASLQSLYDELSLALGEGRKAASGSFPNAEINGRLKVTEMVTRCLPTPEGSTNCRLLDENFTLLSEEEMDQFCLQKWKRNVLPSISKGEEFAFGNKKAIRKKMPFLDCTKPLKPLPPQTAPCVKKSKLNSSRDITPWDGNSLLDTFFSAIPESLEPFPCHTRSQQHLPCSTIKHWCGFAKDLREENNFSRNQDGHQGTGSKAAQQSLQAVPEGPTEAKAFLTRRRLRDKLQGGTKLPPVQSISNLSFSRNFTFSFFELPQYQSQQYRAQRTLMMKQMDN